MAESENGLNTSVLGGSDVIFNFYCQPCDSENLYREACGYCEQCQEYLCDKCKQNHRQHAAFRSHNVLDKEAMPETSKLPEVVDVLTETCPKHVDDVLGYFCDVHKELCCKVCLNTKHNKCKYTAYIPDISDGIASSGEYKELAAYFDRLDTMATLEQVKIASRQSDNDADLSKAKDNIIVFQNEINENLDGDVEDAINKVYELYQENLDTLNSAAQKCQSVLSDINAITTGFAEKSNANMNNQLFVDMKLATERLTTIEDKLKSTVNCKPLRYKFDKDNQEQYEGILQEVFYPWCIAIYGIPEVEAWYSDAVYVKTREDDEVCAVNDIIVLTGGRIVISDNGNSAVKLIDRVSNTVTSSFPISPETEIYGLTSMEPNQVAVSLGEELKIEILTVSDVLSRSRTVYIPGDVFHALTYDGENFVILYPGSRSIKRVAMSGQILSTVYADDDTDPYPLITSSDSIAMRPGGNVIHVTDPHARTVITMTLKGDVISVWSPARLSHHPSGVVVGRDGAVYVFDYSSGNVYQLPAMGQHWKIILDGCYWELRKVLAIAYDDESDSLCLSSDNALDDELEDARVYVKLFTKLHDTKST